MKTRSILGALSIIALSVTPVFAEESLEERVKRLEEALRKAQERESREVPADGSSTTTNQYPMPAGPITDIKVERKGEERVPFGFGSTGSGN